MYENVIGSDAGLPSVKKFAEDDSLGGGPKIGGLIHDAWALAAKLESDRSQVAGSRLHYDLSHRRVTCIEDVIEALGEKRSRDVGGPFYHGGAPRIEVTRYESGERLRAVRAYFRRFDNHAIAGGNGRREGHQRELNGTVPWRNDEHDAQRFAYDERLGWHQSNGIRNPLGSHPGAQLLSYRSD